ncbi:MAG: tRNA-dihydrouridine synthase, partial [Pseudomonadota bacterium]
FLGGERRPVGRENPLIRLQQEPAETLPLFLEAIAEAGVRRVIIHARKAWLHGLSPKENRDVPPLDYPLVHRMKVAFPQMHMSINGGITTLDEAERQLDVMDGVMIGRAAYHSPAEILLQADQRIFAADWPALTAEEAVGQMRPYIARHLEEGGRLNQVTRHMLGLFTGRPGARHWRRILSEGAHKAGAGLEVLDAALDHVIQVRRAAE